MNKEKDHILFVRWYIWFLPSSWIIVSLLLFLQIPQKILLQQQTTNKEKNSSVTLLLKNKEKENLQKDPQAVILSDSDNQEQGKLTKEKDFIHTSPQNDLTFARKGSRQKTSEAPLQQEQKNVRQKKIKRNSSFVVKFVRLIKRKIKQKEKGGNGGVFAWAKSDYTRIPDSYTFQKKFALAWTDSGQPIIPTKKYQHYAYFRGMIEKIRNHWYPPGGSYYPPIGDDFFTTSGYAPGYTRVQTFPEQEIQTVFMLDTSGNVIDVKVFQSLGYRSLDQSCLDAINKSKNFGPPPKELLERGVLIVPFLFRLIAK